MFYIFFIACIFIIIAIVKNKEGEYLKQSAFSVLILSILISIILSLNISLGASGSMSPRTLRFSFIVSVIVALIGLITYLFADAEK